MILGAKIMKKYYVYFDNRDKDASKIGIGLKNQDFVKPSQHDEKKEGHVGIIFLILLLTIMLTVSFYVVCKRKINAVDFGDLKIGKKNPTFKTS